MAESRPLTATTTQPEGAVGSSTSLSVSGTPSLRDCHAFKLSPHDSARWGGERAITTRQSSTVDDHQKIVNSVRMTVGERDALRDKVNGTPCGRPRSVACLAAAVLTREYGRRGLTAFVTRLGRSRAH
jgi:hypothetical protein